MADPGSTLGSTIGGNSIYAESIGAGLGRKTLTRLI